MELSWTEVFKSLVFWGPGAVIAGLMIWALYKLANNLGKEFIKVQQEQARALGMQAQSVEGLKGSIEGFFNRDNSDHREMIILMKVITEKIEKWEKRTWMPKKSDTEE